MKLEIDTKFNIGDKVVLIKDIGKKEADIMEISSFTAEVTGKYDDSHSISAWCNMTSADGIGFGRFKESELVPERIYKIVQRILNTEAES